MLSCGTKTRTWAVIAEDGRHTWLGRETDPTPDEVEAVAAGLAALRLAGWLVVVEGTYYGRGELDLLMVRQLAEPFASWDQGAAAFRAIRHQAIASAA